ncbi:hypothetical protein AUC71_10390 [Methyloceanibacter marginalis]|uniref:Creatinase N-terminal domain-containing protein n=1 Tax=Methyloceanibacter marginalis TaxID=1774971 RepID=A0A1E3WBV2_9HYPH|nr:hypothetical protein AUC71_10390 [Methyloceanibacter marginalis]
MDGRYILQAPKQVDTDIFEVLQVPEAKPSEWLKETLVKGNAVGYDPALHTIKEIDRLTKSLGAEGIRLTPVPENPIDKLWEKDRPRPPMAGIVHHSVEFSGRSAAEKIAQVQDTLKEDNQDAVLLTAPDSICWLFNIRGGDIKHTPVALAFAIVPKEGRPTLFIDPAKVDENVRGTLQSITDIAKPGELDGALKRSPSRRRRCGSIPTPRRCASRRRWKWTASNTLPARILARCPRRPRRRRRSPARGPRIFATARPWCAFSLGSTRSAKRAAWMRSPRR